jgi:FMN phosphatase YigB (HAD superfamily)
LGVVSDYPAEDKLTALGIRQFFDVVVCARRIPTSVRSNPVREGCRSASRVSVSDAEHALYVGDRPETDAVAARSSA